MQWAHPSALKLPPVQIRLDELIRALVGANNGSLDLDKLDDETLERLKAVYEKLPVRTGTALSGEQLSKRPGGDQGGPSPRSQAIRSVDTKSKQDRSASQPRCCCVPFASFTRNAACHGRAP